MSISKVEEYYEVINELNDMLPENHYLSFNYRTNGYQHIILFLDEVPYNSESDSLYYIIDAPEDSSEVYIEKEYSVLEYCLKSFKEYQKGIKSIKLRKA